MAVDGGKVLGGAATGAAVGAPLGPIGMGVGAVGGALLGAFSGGDNEAPQAPTAQFAAGNGSDLTNHLAALQYSEGLTQQQAQNAREAAFYNQGNGNFDIANAAQMRQGPTVYANAADQQRQLAALGATNAGVANMNSTGNLLTGMGTAPQGASYAEAQLRQGQSDAMAQQLAMARSGRSLGSGQAAMNQAAFNNAGINQATNQQAASARLQEQQNYNQFQLGALQGAGNAYAGAGGLAGQAGNQATTVRAGNEGLQAQNAALGQQQLQINNQTTGMYNQLGAQQQQLGMQANSQGQNAYQFGAQQGQQAQIAQMNANLGQASSTTATNIANQNNASAHDAATMNMVSAGAGALADTLGNANSTPAVNANNPSGSTSPYANITTSSNTAGPSNPRSDERVKTNIQALGGGGADPNDPIMPVRTQARPPSLLSPAGRASKERADAYLEQQYAAFSPEDAAAYRAADERTAAGHVPDGTLMDHEDLGKKAVENETPSVANYGETIAALDNAYRPSQFAPADVLNHKPGAGAGYSPSQAALLAHMSGGGYGAPSAAAEPGGIDARFTGRDPGVGAPMSGAQLSGLGRSGMLAPPSSRAPGPLPVAGQGAPASNWGDVFNAPQLDPRVAAYLAGQSAQPSPSPASVYPTTTKQGQPSSQDYLEGTGNGPSMHGALPGIRSSDVHSKTRIRDLETQLAALSADGPPTRGESTQLRGDQEPGFQRWLKQNSVRDLDNPNSHYDYRGAYLGGAGRGGNTGHFPDTWKQHGHETFSNESQYSRSANDGGSWDGERFSPAVAPRAPDTAALDASEYGRQVRPGGWRERDQLAGPQSYPHRWDADPFAAKPGVDFRNAHGYSYEYKDPNAPGAAPGTQVGTMAQELERTTAAPYVHDTPNGKVVDTSRLPLALAPAIGETQRRVDDLEAQLAALQGSGLGPMAQHDRSLYPQMGAR